MDGPSSLIALAMGIARARAVPFSLASAASQEQIKETTAMLRMRRLTDEDVKDLELEFTDLRGLPGTGHRNESVVDQAGPDSENALHPFS